MAVTYTHPFECSECTEHPSEDFYHFPVVDDWMIAYPDKHLAHLHFGSATDTEELNTKETQWIIECCQDIFAKYPGNQMYVLVDMTRSDDSEYPSRESMQLYKDILHMPELGHIVFYGVSTGMIFFLNLLIQFARKNLSVVRTKAEADALYQRWLKENFTSGT